MITKTLKNIGKIVLLSALLLSIALFIFFYVEIKKTESYSQEIFSAAESYELSPELIFAVIRAESNYDPNAVSRSNARGLMQIMPATASDIANTKGVVYDVNALFDYKINLDFGCYYLKQMLDSSNNQENALASYNAGIGNVEKWLTDVQYSTDQKTLDYIPYSETRKYVKKIAFFEKIYQFLIPIYY